MAQWCIFYSNGTAVRGADNPVQAPKSGFVCAVSFNSAGERYIMQGWDYYRWNPTDSEFWGHDLRGIIDWAQADGLIKSIDPGTPTIFHTIEGDYDTVGLIEWLRRSNRIFVGEMVSNAAYAKILALAHSHPDFPYPGYEDQWAERSAKIAATWSAR